MARDSQRSKLYAWERKALFPDEKDRRFLSLAECEDLIVRAWRRYGIAWPPPKVGDGRRRTGACYSRAFHMVKLPRWARFPEVVLHEVAHAIVGHHARRDISSHGPEFLRVYIELVAIFLKKDAGEMKKSARGARLKVAPASQWGAPPARKAKKLERLTKEVNILRVAAQQAKSDYDRVRNEQIALSKEISPTYRSTEISARQPRQAAGPCP